jgi:ATP-dependent helicase/DNAse subunit B
MKLIRGAPGSGKTALVFREFREALHSSTAGPGVKALRIVVPTATLVRHFQHELARDGIVFSPHYVISLNRLVRERALPAGPAVLLPEGLKRALVRDALVLLKFPEFASVATTSGMTATVLDTIELFENAGGNPDQLASSVRRLGSCARPFEKLWRSVREEAYRRGYCFRSDLLRAAASNPAPARIWLDGFAGFSPVEREFLRGLDKVCDITLTLTDSNAADEVRKFAMELGARDILLPGRPRQPRETLIAAPTIEREADEIARRILQLNEQGTDFRRIGIALRDSSTYVPLLKGVFERFGIPARFYFSSPLRKHPVAIFLGGLIDGVLNGWDFEAAITTLRAHPGWGTRADFDRFEYAVREAMPGRGPADLLHLCQAPWLHDEIANCLKIDAWKTAVQKPDEWAQRIEALAANVYRPGRLEIPRDHSGIEMARSHVAALQAWLDTISSVCDFWTPARAISLAEFWSVASFVIDSAIVRPVDDRAGVVHVMDAHEARQWDVAALFVCGMTDRDFPRQPPRNLLFPDSDIEILRKSGVMLRRSADYEDDERWLYQSLRTRATQALFLSRPERDVSGKSVQPSRLLDRAVQPETARLCQPLSRTPAPHLPGTGRISSAALQSEIAGLHQSISITSLEDLTQCRFKFFSRKTLLLKDAPEPPGERLQPLVLGSIMHAALERWLTDKSRDFVDVFEIAFDEACRARHLPPGYKLEVERIRFREIARSVSASDLWTPDSSDVEVPLTLEFPGGIQVQGRVDRIDRFGGDCVIVDYKSGKIANVAKLITSRTKLQGPLYALAARENLGLNPVAMIFWAARDDKPFGWGAVPGGIDLGLLPIPDNWIADAKARTVGRISDFLGGDVRARPEEAGECRWCDFVAACRVEQTVLVQVERAQVERARGA